MGMFDGSDDEVVVHPQTLASMDEEKKRQFLDMMSQLESSGGINTKHREISSGIHKGQRAVGNYGLMPNTIREMYKRMGKDADPRLKEIVDNSQDDQMLANSIAADPELENVVAGKLYDRVNERFGGDQEKMNYAWQYGHNLSPSKLTSDKLENDRTEKFRLLKKVVKPKE